VYSFKEESLFKTFTGEKTIKVEGKGFWTTRSGPELEQKNREADRVIAVPDGGEWSAS
jgi:hypothetical protein